MKKNIDKYELIIQFRSAYLKKEKEQRKILSIYDITEWGIEWWKEKGYDLLEEDLRCLLNAYREVHFYQQFILKAIER